MNNEQNIQQQQFLPRHTEYIRTMSDRTGRSYRELEAEWKKAEREFDFERMRDPLKYANMRRTNGSMAQEISRRFEENVVNPELEADDQIEDVGTDMAEEQFGDAIETGIEGEGGDSDYADFSEEGFDDGGFDDGGFDDFSEDEEEPASEDSLNTLLDDIVGEDSIDLDLDEEETLNEEPTEGVPNKSLDQQRSMERPSEESTNSPDDVNKSDS